jgi:DNA-binding transcriptional ArsR family regulator
VLENLSNLGNAIVMTQILHPKLEDISLSGVLYALGDPIRLKIVETILQHDDGMNCSMASQQYCETAKSTLSNHFRILRENGIIHTTKRGVENINRIRREELEALFPGLLENIVRQITHNRCCTNS